MKLRRTTHLVSVLAASALGLAAWGSESSGVDKRFAAEAASGGMLEVRLGEYAGTHAKSDDVKKFGERMAGDHNTANQEFQTIASEQSVELPKQLNEKDQKTLEKLEKLDGAEFDRQYMADMVEDHKSDIAAFEKETSEGTNVRIKGFAEKSLPMLKHHLKMAEELAAKL